MQQCPECGFELLDLAPAGHEEALFDCVYDELNWIGAAAQILEAADKMASDLELATVGDALRKPSCDRWSALEYACHLRDVLAYQRERVLRALRGFGREALPMGRNERAVHDRYQEQDRFDVAEQLRQAAKLFVNLVNHLESDKWDLTVEYMFPEPGSRSLRWLVVHSAHEAVHHLHDVRSSLTSPEPR